LAVIGLMKHNTPMFNCYDCQVDTLEIQEYYTVKGGVWAAAGGGHGLLCIGCLENRLKRRLTKTDFSSTPVNWLFSEQQSQRLLDRLAAD
jgi:hypothetical protein